MKPKVVEVAPATPEEGAAAEPERIGGKKEEEPAAEAGAKPGKEAKEGAREEKKEKRGVGEPSFSVRQRAFKKEEAEEQGKLPMDEGLPPGVSPKSRKKDLRAKEAAAKKSGKRDAKDTRTMGCIDRTATEVYDTIQKD